ncbi:MAG: HlyD family type I secretion periplasmic adaptor subunit [Alphaproteobacteria bacterium]|nr:HlyD family type I secretion periplasmic adaptor subunit [Alphaproteobacteria bacterium]
MNQNFSPKSPVLKLAPAQSEKPKAAPPPDFFKLAQRPMWFGLISAGLLFLVFGGWAATAPLVGGATASGVVSPDSSRRVIQNLEGGIVREVFVRENTHVAKGQPLVTLDSIRAEATYSARREQWLRFLVVAARVKAQMLDADHVTLPRELEQFPSAELDDFAASQIALFESRRNSLDQQQQILDSQIEQAKNQIEAIRAQNAGLDKQVALINEEIATKIQLLDQQLINRSDVLSLQREQASLESAAAANIARIAETEQTIGEIRFKLLQAGEQFRERAAEEDTEVNDSLASIEKEMIATGDVLERTQLYSPADGTVINLKHPTPGGVVGPGEEIMSIVPLEDQLIVVARLNPRDIDLVHEGLTANVQLVPFSNRNALPLAGTVVQVAADAKLDEATQQSFYEVRVRVEAEEVAKHEGMYLRPGMPAEVIIVTGERTMLEYLLEPVVSTLRTAFVYD